MERLPELPLRDTAAAVEAEFPKLVADYVLDLVLSGECPPEEAQARIEGMTRVEEVAMSWREQLARWRNHIV